MKRILLTLALCVGAATPAHAFTIASGFTHGCHEEISLDAFDRFFLEQPTFGVPVSQGTTWRELSLFFRDTFGLAGTPLDPVALTDAQRFMLTSLLVGVRSPDTDGHSVLNLENLRLLHSDPSPEGQYAHALRGPGDDVAEGNTAAVEGTRHTIRRLVALAIDLEDDPDLNRLVRPERFYLDFYGTIDVDVYVPMFLLGQAAHALQDSFSHAIRDDSESARAQGTAMRQIVHSLNYVDAIGGDFDEHRDGLAHSDSMDDCLGDTEGIVTGARNATFDLFFAHRAVRKGLDSTAVESLLDKWVTLREGCDASNQFCGNAHWLAVVREAQTEPYFEAFFGCGTSPGAATGGLTAWALLALFLLRTRRRSRPTA